jgi:hypothetical protein
VGHRLYLGSKINGIGSSSTYIFIDDTLSPSSTYIATNADGWSTSSTYDYAERYLSADALLPGELVTTDPTHPEYVKRVQGISDTPIGIVSTKPGFITGGYIKGTFPIALAGRVPTNVSSQNGSIHIGDPLTASTIPGVAMKLTSPGTIVGFALEDFIAPGTGTISVFVSPGYHQGSLTADGVTTSTPAGIAHQEGLAKIYAGQTSVKISFAAMEGYPMIHVRPYGQVTDSYWVDSVSDTSFTIVLGTSPTFETRAQF